MYCNNCGKQIEEDSVFCQFCGNKINTVTQSSEDKSTDKKTKSDPSKKDNTNNSLWDKFAEVYDAKDEERKKFDSYSSTYVWEITNRLAENAFEEFLKNNKDEINKQPYKTVEALKNAYIWTVIGGYRLWLAEALLKREKLGEFKAFSLDRFIDEWKKYDFDKAAKSLSDEMGIAITQYRDFRVNSFIEIAPEAKEMPTELIEKLKMSLLWQVVNGYHAGNIENNFRK